MAELTTYLKKLKFDSSLSDSPFAQYIRNTRLVILLVMLVTMLGIYSFINLPRVLNPDIKIPIVLVTTTLPGASPDNIESLVTIPVEDGVNSLPKIKTVTSTSQDSVSVVSIEFESGVDPDKAKDDVQSAIDSITNLPTDAKKSIVQKLDFTNEPVWTFDLSSKNDSLSLIRFGKTLRDDLKDLPSIDHVDTTGVDDEEIQVLIQPEKLAAYGISPATIQQVVKAGIGSYPAGTITTNASSFVLSLDPTITSVAKLRNMRIQVNKQTVLLSDVATVEERTKPDAATSYIASKTQQPIETVRFDVYKTDSANITQAVADAQKLVTKMTTQYGNKFTVSSDLNSADQVNKQYYDLIRDLLITISLVFLTLFLFLGLRQAIVASFAIPLTFLVTFTVMNITGIALSFIAFFSLLLSLGLLVDDTIVVISALTAYYRSGKFSPFEAGLLVWRDFRTAIVTTTLTTVWAFVPLLLSTGIIGEFIKPIPIVVSSTLLGSLGVALFITLPLFIMLLSTKIPYRITMLFRILGVVIVLVLFLTIMPKGPLFIPAFILFVINVFVYFQVRYLLYTRARERMTAVQKPTDRGRITRYINSGVIDFSKIERKYRFIIAKILSKSTNRRSMVIAVIAFSIFSYTLLPLGYVNNQFFPASGEDYLYLSLELPTGTNISKTKSETLQILRDVRALPNVAFATASMRLGIDPGRGFSSAGDNTSLITLVLVPEGQRTQSSIDIAESLRKHYASFQDGTLSVVEVSGGPPAGSDVQIKLSGDDLATLDTYANRVQAYLKKQQGVTNVEKSVKSGTSKIVFVPDDQKMLDANVTQAQMGQWLQTYASGFTLDENAKLQEGNNQSQNVMLRTSTAPETAQGASSITMSTPNGPVPLLSLGNFELRPNPSLITREDGKRTISVTASVTKGYNATQINTQLEKFADTLGLPSGYSWGTGGANEENDQSVQAILAAMILSFLLIIVTMVLQFSSFRKAFIVMLVIPLSISGVFILFALTQTPLSFPALIGVLALFGIVVKNSILIVDKINKNLKQNMTFLEAIVDGAESRLEPITLTTIATIVGLIPITLSDPLWRGLGGAIIAGLFFSGTTMLFFIPVVYYLMFKNSEGKAKPKTA